MNGSLCRVVFISVVLMLAAFGASACATAGQGRLVQSAAYVVTAPAKHPVDPISRPGTQGPTEKGRRATFPLAPGPLDAGRPESLAQIALVHFEKHDFVKAGHHFVRAAQHPGAASRSFRIAVLAAGMMSYLHGGPQLAKAFGDTAILLRHEVEQAADLVVDLEVEALLALAATRRGQPGGPSRLPWNVRGVLNPMASRTEVTK